MPSTTPHSHVHGERLIGAVVLRRYRIGREVGRGATSVVHAAIDLATQHRLAIKVLRASANAAASERLLAEARMLARLRDPNILRVVDYGLLDDERPLMVMEFLEGCTLHRLLRRSGPLPWPLAKPLLLSACTALQAVHDVGIVHRDVKPQNLFVLDRAQKQRVKVLDFGLANDPRSPLTGPGVGLRNGEWLLLGTPGFIAPEQITSAEVDARADVYALGVTLFLMLTGRLPFLAEHPVRQMAEHMYVDPPLLRSLQPHLPAALEALVGRALAKDPAERIASMDAFRREAAAIPEDDEPTLLRLADVIESRPEIAAPEPIVDDEPTTLVVEPPSA